MAHATIKILRQTTLDVLLGEPGFDCCKQWLDGVVFEPSHLLASHTGCVLRDLALLQALTQRANSNTLSKREQRASISHIGAHNVAGTAAIASDYIRLANLEAELGERET